MTMKGKMILFVILFSGLLLSGAYGDVRDDISKVVEDGYFNGAFNSLDTASMEKAFHPTFAIFSAKGKDIGRYPIDVWIKGIEKMKIRPDFDPSRVKRDCKIVNIDATGNCASVKVEIGKDGKRVYTDYLSLLKFEDGWKIVAKVYHHHK